MCVWNCSVSQLNCSQLLKPPSISHLAALWRNPGNPAVISVFAFVWKSLNISGVLCFVCVLQSVLFAFFNIILMYLRLFQPQKPFPGTEVKILGCPFLSLLSFQPQELGAKQSYRGDFTPLEQPWWGGFTFRLPWMFCLWLVALPAYYFCLSVSVFLGLISTGTCNFPCFNLFNDFDFI